MYLRIVYGILGRYKQQEKEAERMEYRALTQAELNRKLLDGFIRHQVVTDCWRRENGGWVIRPDPFIDDWSEQEKQALIQELQSIGQAGGFLWAGFQQGQMKGFVSVAPGRFGPQQEYMDLTNLHVSEELRRTGIGRRLFRAAAGWAWEQGAKKLYLSAHSAAESQAFYRTLGCVDALYPQKKHQEAEPFDCQLEYPLDTDEGFAEEVL